MYYLDALASDLTQQLPVEKVLRASPPDTKLILRLMTHISGMDYPPQEVCIKAHLHDQSLFRSTTQI